MPLQDPPHDLTSFPLRRYSNRLRTLYRVVWHRDRHGNLNQPWNYTSCPPGTNRFDLPDPEGTCYWSDESYGAFLETFRGAKVIASVDVAAKRLWVAKAPRERLANLLAPKAASVGVTAAISTQPDYEQSQRWAAALRHLGFEGVVGTCSHDPTSNALNVAIFGPAGVAPNRPGWVSTATSIEADVELHKELAKFGILIVDVPHDVAITGPPL